MKYLLSLLISIIGLLLYNSIFGNDKIAEKSSSLKKNTINFKSQVQPVLQKNCSPCHFPGGKLYEKLPFDKGETVISHETGILKRITKTDEVSLIKQFVEQNKITD